MSKKVGLDYTKAVELYSELLKRQPKDFKNKLNGSCVNE